MTGCSNKREAAKKVVNMMKHFKMPCRFSKLSEAEGDNFMFTYGSLVDQDDCQGGISALKTRGFQCLSIRMQRLPLSDSTSPPTRSFTGVL